MKIIYYSPHPTHDIVSEVGYSTHQRETIQAMRELNHEVCLVIMGGTEKQMVTAYHNELGKEGLLKKWMKKLLPLILINSVKDLLILRHDRIASRELKKAILEFKPDLVYERNEYMQDRGTRLCKKTGIKHFLEVNSPAVDEMRSFEGPSFFHFLGHIKEKNKLKDTQKIFCVSSSLKDYLLKRYAVQNEVLVIPNCINPNKDLPDSQSIERVKKELNLHDKEVIGFVGSIFPYHGVDKLVLAFQQLQNERKNMALVVVGGGVLKTELENKAKDILKPGTFVFTGNIPHKEVFAYMAAFDVAVMPDSNWYGSPVKVLEYGLMRKPVVAPNNGPLNDIIVHGKEGILVNSGVDSLAQGLSWALQNISESSEMANKFYEKIMHHFTWKKQAEYILSHC